MRDTLKRSATFLLVGLLNTGFGYLAYAALVLIGLPLWVAVGGTLIISIIFNFYSYGGVVFNNTSLKSVPRFLVLYVIIGLVNYGLLQAITKSGVGPLVAQALILPILALIGYFGMKIFVFGSMSEARIHNSRVNK